MAGTPVPADHVGEMDAETTLTPDEVIAADALFAELVAEREDDVTDLAVRRVLRSVDADDGGDEQLAAAG